MLQTVINPVSSRVKSVISLVIEEVSPGVEIVSTFGSNMNGKPFSLASLFGGTPAIAQEKPVTLIPPVVESKPVPMTPAKVDAPKPVVGTLDELKAKAKAAGVKGAHLFKDAAKLQEKIDAKSNTVPAPKAANNVTVPQQTPAPRGGRGKGKPGGTIKKDSFKLSTSSKAIVWNKDYNKQMEVFIVEEFQYKNDHAENVKAQLDPKAGYVVCNPDEGGINKKEDTVFGATWGIPHARFIKWVD